MASAVSEQKTANEKPRLTGWLLLKLLCFSVIVLSILLCIAIAISRSNGLIGVTVTALNEEDEPQDNAIPLFNDNDALPDYELVVFLGNGERTSLGAKPNQSAIKSLTWDLNDPISVSEISGIRLLDQDKLISDVIEEVQITGSTAKTDRYEYQFLTEASWEVGVKSFFGTPIGKSISGAFFVAVLMILFSLFNGFF